MSKEGCQKSCELARPQGAKHILEVEGFESVRTPLTGKSISISIAFALRASERSCVSARESPSVARARQRNLSVRPPPPGAVRIKSSSSESFDR